MKPTIALLAVLACFQSIAQNVGIGTTTPSAKLQINHRTTTGSPGLQLLDSTNFSGGSLRFRNINNAVGMNMSSFTNSVYNKDQYLDITSDSLFIGTFRGNGNVGIRNDTPLFPLDVSGDINTTGSIRTNGSTGASGQVLRSNGDGTMTWGDMSDYKFYETYRATGASTWTVPAGVTKVCIELWGAGGGGAIHGGGGGGGYIKAYFTVTPGATVSYTIGVGGNGGNFAGSAANIGGSSVATVSGVSITASGGGGAASAVAGEQPGSGGDYSVSPGFRNFTGIDGKNGEHNQITYSQKNATTYVITTKYGNGGDSGSGENTGGKGNYTVVNESTAAILKEGYAMSSNIPGGGGGTFYCSFCNSSPGAGGQVIFHY